jgi:hypothetical protein
MTGLDKIKPNLPDIVSWVLTFFGTATKSQVREEIKGLYGPDVKLSLSDPLHRRTRGADAVTDVIIKQNGEFTSESFTYLLTDDAHLLINGTAIWKNARHAFSFVVEIQAAESPARAIVVNQIFLKL